MDEETTIDQDVEGRDEAISPEEMFERNLATFQELLPNLHQRLVSHKPVSRLEFLDNGEPTVEFQNFQIYKRGAVTEAKEQTDRYEAHSVRFHINSVEADGLDFHSREAYVRFKERVDQSGLKFTGMPVKKEAYFLIVVGIGLAQHLDALVEKAGCWVLVLIEPNFDFIYHSCSVYDWRPLLEKMQSRGAIEFMLNADPSHTSDILQSMFRAHNPVGLDGAILFRHYQTSVTGEIERELTGKLRTAVMGLGFFQDEVNMVGQTYKNLESGKARVVRQIPESPDIPCFVVGTGPSLETLLPFIKANQEKAVIFSCGTSIDVLMANDIEPDFWVMMERSKNILPQAQETADMFDLSNVRFGGSTTIFPGVPDFFKEALYFFRPGLTPAPLFATRADQAARIPDPLAANAGLSLALHLGFREFYFMGVDVGSKFKERGHAKGSWYERHDAENIKNLKIPLPGNFGGTVWTDGMLQWSKENLEKLARTASGRVIYNLGDGAQIKGTVPKHPKAVKLKKATRPKNEIVDEIVEKCPIYSLEDFENRWESTAIIDRLPEYLGKLRDAVVDDEMTDYRYARNVATLCETRSSSNALATFVRGTVFGFMIAFEWWNNRLVDEDEREVLRNIFKDEYATLLNHMRDRSIEVFTALEDGEPWEEFES